MYVHVDGCMRACYDMYMYIYIHTYIYTTYNAMYYIPQNTHICVYKYVIGTYTNNKNNSHKLPYIYTHNGQHVLHNMSSEVWNM